MAVRTLLGACANYVIARSFSFVYARNQRDFGLLEITMSNEEVFSLVGDDVAAVELR